MARRISLFEREVQLRLAPVAVELIHATARVLTEGEVAGGRYTGSTMLTVDLARAADRISDVADAATASRVAVLYAADERARAEARLLALGEARRHAGCDLGRALVDVESRARGAEIHLSLDVEASVTALGGAVR